MDKMKLAEKNKILEFRIGSHLYGTNTETSDEDFSGVFMPDEDHVFGFERVDQVDLSIKSKRDDGKNAADAIDKSIYEFRKFVRLALDNNPNILEQVFINEENIIFQNDFGAELLSHGHLFPHKGLSIKFLKYAHSQKHKMIIRTDSFYALQNAYDWLEENTVSPEDSKKLLIEVAKDLPFFTIKGDCVKCGDLNFQRHHLLKKVKKMIGDRLMKAGNRKELYLKHGYDTKFASHLIRLLKEGISLLNTGTLVFPLPNASEILEIKSGTWKQTEVLTYAGELEETLKEAEIHSVLPANSRYKKVQELVKNMLKNHLEFQNESN